MSKEQNKLIMYRMIEEIWNKGNLAAADEIFSADHFSPSAPDLPKGPESVKMLAGMFRAAMPDYHMNIDLLMSDDTKVVARFTQSGTHTGAPLMGMEPSGRRAEWTEIGILEIHGGKVTQSWYEVDMLALIGQLNPSQDTVEQNKDLIVRYFDTIWNHGQLEREPEFVATDIVVHQSPIPGIPPGIAGPLQIVGTFRASIPDIHLEHILLFGEGDKVVHRWEARGHHTAAPLFGAAISNKEIIMTGINTFRVANGRIVERWGHMDTLGLLTQLGLVPAN